MEKIFFLTITFIYIAMIGNNKNLQNFYLGFIDINRHQSLIIETNYIFPKSIPTSQVREKKNKDGNNPQRIAVSYLKWYLANKSNFNFNPISETEDSTKAYRIDFKALESFLKKLQLSGFVSSNYLKNFRYRFEHEDHYLKAHPQSDGSIFGFEPDYVLNILDETDITLHIKSLKLINKKISGNKAILIYEMSKSLKLKLKFELTRYNSKWLIDSFDTSYTNFLNY